MVYLQKKKIPVVCSKLSVAEPPGRFVGDEVPSVRREVYLDQCSEVVIVSHINYRVPKDTQYGKNSVPISHRESHSKSKKDTQE